MCDCNKGKILATLFSDYAAQDGGDQTANLASAVTAAMASSDRVLDITGAYSATQVNLQNISGLRIVGRGTVVGIASSPTPALIDIRNAQNLNVDADWFPNASYNMNYEAGVRAWAQTGENISYCRFNGVSPVNAKTAWKFGDDGYPDVLISETEIRGGMTRGCPSAVLAIGTQAVIQINGGNLLSSTADGNVAWGALPQRTVVARGATITRVGGENLHTGLSTGGTDSSWNALFHVESISSPVYGAIVGNINVTGGIVETATFFGTTANPSGLPNTKQGAINVSDVRCASMSNGYFMASDGGFTGRLCIKGASDFFSVPLRTFPTFYAGNAACKIITDHSIFGDNFVHGSGAFVGGTQIIGP